MGVEYKVSFASEDPAQVDKFLRALPCFAEFDQQWGIYMYREAENTGKMPNAEVRLEAGGLYLCDYGMSNHLFGFLIARLISHFGSVQIEDWE